MVRFQPAVVEVGVAVLVEVVVRVVPGVGTLSHTPVAVVPVVQVVIVEVVAVEPEVGRQAGTLWVRLAGVVVREAGEMGRMAPAQETTMGLRVIPGAGVEVEGGYRRISRFDRAVLVLLARS